MDGTMGGRGSLRHRFTLLLLEDGEDYICDWVGFCLPPAGKLDASAGASVRGRLRLCSMSLFFDPDEQRLPILKFPFAHCEAVERDAAGEAVCLSSTHWLRLKENGVDSPYVHDKAASASVWRFSLAFASMNALLAPAKQQLALCRLPHWERAAALKEAAKTREDGAQFDPSRLFDLSERPLLSIPAAQVTLLLREPGRLVVTRARAYFQPLHNLGADTPVRSRPLSALAAVARRRHQLRHTALELFFSEPDAKAVGGWEGGSVFLTFHSVQERDEAAAALKQQPALGGASGAAAALAASALLEAEPAWLGRVQSAWARGEVSNFDYLLYLNLAAGRSQCDLTQWPVFPWVLADYSSPQLELGAAASFRDLAKPVGALNPTRLASLRERARQMASTLQPGEKPFLYGTHYSTPGYTLFWLLRALPAHALRLQGGRFDAPDRLFCGVREAWEGVMRAPADVKELTPEFYSPGDGAWLLNLLSLPLGTRQNGQSVGEVALPPWSANPQHFLACMRAALESPHVSERLHLWIDLVFGVAQRGEAAVARDNLFHPLTYEGAVDLDAPGMDAAAKAAALQQIDEFGQTPRQLFKAAHPQRSVRPPVQLPRADAPASVGGTRGGTAALVRMLLAVAAPFTSQPGSGPAPAPAQSARAALSASTSAAAPTSTPAAPPPPRASKPAPPTMGALRLPRLKLRRASVEAQPLWSARPHRGAGCALALSADAAYSVGRDTWLRVRSLADGSPLHASQLGRLPLSSVALLPPQPLAPAGSRPACLAGSLDGCIYLASVDYGSVLGKLRAHDDAVSQLAMPTGLGGARLVSCGWDGTVKLWDLAGGRALDGSAGPGGEAATPPPLLELSSGEGQLWALGCCAQGVRLVCGGSDGCVALWDSRSPPSAGPAWQVSASPTGVQQLAVSDDAALVFAACEDGVLRLLDSRRGGQLAAQAEASPSVSSASSSSLPAVRCCALAGATLLAGTDAGELVAWDSTRAAPSLVQPPRGAAAQLQGEPQLWRCGVGAPVRAVAVSPNGAAGCLSADGWLKVWQGEGWEEAAKK